MARKKRIVITDEMVDEVFSKPNVDEEQTRLLRKMIERQNQDLKLSRVIAFAECALLAVLIIVFAFLVPRFLFAVERVKTSMDQVDQLVDHAETSMSEMVDLVRDADRVAENNEESVGEAIRNFNSVDFESLNRSIASISKVVEPVADIIKILKE